MDPRKIPAIHLVMNSDVFKSLTAEFPISMTKKVLQEILESIRQTPDNWETDDISVEALGTRAARQLSILYSPSLQPLVNATGTILHTNLGRAPLSKQSIESILNIAAGYSNLEFDLTTGKRGHRSDHVSSILRELTGAEAALVVNNNAGAVLLTLTANFSGKEVVVSRGELIEIGGGFRIPEVMAYSGSTLVEVGTTNRTHPRDYRKAITPDTGLLFKAHYSNFAMVGFTSQVTLDGLLEIGREQGVPVMYDLGSGCLLDSAMLGLTAEHVRDVVSRGTDIVTFSGDKLLGGPQAGIILGRKSFVEKAAAHPLARALRIDKLTLAALEATLTHYRDYDETRRCIPVIRMIQETADCIQQRLKRITDSLDNHNLNHLRYTAQAGESTVGGGALPTITLPTWILVLESTHATAQEILGLLRNQRPSVIARIDTEKVLLDLRTVADSDLPAVIKAVIGVDQQI